MAVSKTDVEYIAELSKLSFEENEIVKFTDQFNNILNYIDKLNELNTDDVAPMMYPIDNYHSLREDLINVSIDTSYALKNAPDSNEIYF